jgi:hypothetical protein
MFGAFPVLATVAMKVTGRDETWKFFDFLQRLLWVLVDFLENQIPLILIGPEGMLGGVMF